MQCMCGANVFVYEYRVYVLRTHKHNIGQQSPICVHVPISKTAHIVRFLDSIVECVDVAVAVVVTLLQISHSCSVLHIQSNTNTHTR